MLLLLFLYAYEQTLILPSSRWVCVCVCVRCSNKSGTVGHPKCPSIHLTHTYTHISYPRWRSSSQCHFQFGWAHGLFRRYNGLDDGWEMDDAAQVSCNRHSHFWSSHSSGAIFKSSNLTVFQNCMHLKSHKFWENTYNQVLHITVLYLCGWGRLMRSG